MPKVYEVAGTEYEFPDNFSDDQVQGILTQQGVIEPVADPSVGQRAAGGVLSSAMGLAETGKNVLKGAASGLANTVFQGGDLIRRATGQERIINRPEVQALVNPKLGPGGGTGRFIEQAAEFAIPMSATVKAVRGAPLAVRAGAEALTSGAVTAAQTGGDPAAVAVGTAAGAAGPLIGAGWRAVRGASRSPIKLMESAIKPRASNIKFSSSLNTAMPEIAKSSDELARPIGGIDDLVGRAATDEQPGVYGLIQHAKKRIRALYDAAAGPKREMGTMVDLSPVADSMVRSISRKMMVEEPQRAASILERAAQYRKKFKLEDAEEFLKTTNAELEAYFAKNPAAQRVSVAANPETALLNSQGVALRDAIYKTLDAPGQGAAARELQRRYGALMDIEQETLRRRNVAVRQQPASLSEQIGTWAGTGRVVRGMMRLPFQPGGGLADIAEGVAERGAAKWIKEQQTTDALIRKAFKGYASRPVYPSIPSERPPAGLLPPATTRMGPVRDSSSVRAVPAEVVPTTEAERMGRLLPPATTRITPTPPDPSRLVVFDAKAKIARDPKTGRMFKYYTTETK